MQIELENVATHQPVKGFQRKLLRHLNGDDYTLEMDWSSIEAFLSCDRSALWKLIYGRTTYPGAALTYGRAMHIALEHHYRNRAPVSECLAAAEQVMIESPPPVGEWRTFDVLRNAFTKYVAQYANEPFDVFVKDNVPMVEVPFQVPITTVQVNNNAAFPAQQILHNAEGVTAHPFIGRVFVIWTGVIDVVVRQDGKLWIIDHKTSSVVGDSYFKGFELSQQFMGYVHCAQVLLGEQIEGAVANVIAGRKPTKTGTPLEFLRRYYYYHPDQIAEWKSNMTVILEDLMHNVVTGNFPMKTNSCTNKFGTCPYHDVCAQPASIRLTALLSDAYAPNVWNPLD